MVGKLSAAEFEALVEALPVEVSFIGADDAVRYYSKGDKRIFTRVPEVIGRKVQQCHPQHSLAKVQEILDGFRARRLEKAEFWIDARGKKVLIRYFPVRDAKGAYLGALEVTQDITDLQKITGEKRLL